jgi:hypothetical protein
MEWLASLRRHLIKHSLDDVVTAIKLPAYGATGMVHVYPSRGTDLSILAEFLCSLRGTTVLAADFPTDRDRVVHLHAIGGMGDGSPLKVIVIVEHEEFDLLMANASLIPGADVSVDLLLRLVDASTAERRPVVAGSAVSS